MMNVSLSIAEDHYLELRKHLFPGDGLEAVAFVVCGHAAGIERHRLVAQSIHPIPYDRCERNRNYVHWHADDIETLLTYAEREKLSLIKVHSHPQNFSRFSEVDNASDAELLPTISSWVESDIPHGSAIMLPDGKMFGRYQWRDDLKEFDCINVVGPSLEFWRKPEKDASDPEFGASQDQVFGEGTTRRMQQLKIAVVGASGTGAPLIEQLVRLGVGHLVLVDDDKVEFRNLNRITFATSEDARLEKEKVLSAADDIERKGLGTKTTTIVGTVRSRDAIRAIAECDALFGCVDTTDGRFIMSMIASHYVLPYFDIGVLVEAEQGGEKRGSIKDIIGTINYIIPGRSSLLSRDQFTMEDVVAEGLHRNDPVAAAQQVEDKYIKGMRVHRPAVVSINTFAASLAINDFLARLHKYRRQPNSEIASIEFSLCELRITTDEEMARCPVMGRYVGKGDQSPLLSLPELGV